MKNLRLFTLLTILVLVFAACSSATPETAKAPAESGSKTEEKTETKEEAPAPAAATATPKPAESEAPVIKEGESTTEDVVREVSQYNEAPMLAEMVAAGELPPVDERLPKDVQVIDVTDSIGQYGGTWHAVTWWPGAGNIKMAMYDPPIRWKPDYSGYEPGLAKKYEWSEDGTSITFHFREGLKWSDGEPFTMDDMKFWWEDIATNEDYKLIQVPWWGFKKDGTPMDVEFPDDYTMVFRWDTPQWVTPYILAQGYWEWEPLMKPKHFLSKYHPKYNPDATYDQLEAIDKWHETEGYPTLMAWYVQSFTAGEKTLWVRNPYYWKTDPEGNQLPYLDYVQVDLVEDAEVRLLQISQGKFDASFRGTDDPRNIPFLDEQAEANDYQLYLGWVNGAGAWPGWLINQDYIGDGKDPELDAEIREVLRDKRFRRALSHALDRDRVIQVVWDGFGEAKQATISPQSWHFQSEKGQEVYKRWAESYVEFDQDLANSLLDEVGLTERDADGYRMLPSGKDFTIILDLGDWGGEFVGTEGTEIFRDSLDAVGLNVIVNNLVNQPDWDLRQTQGLYMLRNMHASELDVWTYPDWLFPVRDNRSFPLQGKWKQTGGAEGEKPVEGSAVARLQDLYDQGASESDPQKRHELVWEAIDILIEEGPFMIGASGDQPMPVVIKNNFHNVATSGVLGPWAPGSPGNQHPEQYWIEE